MFDVENTSESVQDMSQVFKISSSVHQYIVVILLTQLTKHISFYNIGVPPNISND